MRLDFFSWAFIFSGFVILLGVFTAYLWAYSSSGSPDLVRSLWSLLILLFSLFGIVVVSIIFNSVREN